MNEGARTVTRPDFLDDLVAVTRERTASTHVYVSLDAGGRVWAQWEEPGVDHPRRHRVIDADGRPVCPHCAIIEGVERLAPVLPIDPMRTARSRFQYESVLRTGRLPSMALARRSPDPLAGWLVDCHAMAGDPHADADCDQHGRPRRAAPTGSDDPLAMVEPLPLAVRRQYPDDDAADRDVRSRLPGPHPAAAQGARRAVRRP